MTSLEQLDRRAPRVVDATDFGVVARLRARLGICAQFGPFFLGYCPRHRTYFLDLEHTNGDIRCPICDKHWLVKHHVI